MRWSAVVVAGACLGLAVLADGPLSPPNTFSGGTDASAAAITANFDAVEFAVEDLRQLVIGVRQAQVAIRDRVHAMEWMLEPPAAPDLSASSVGMGSLSAGAASDGNDYAIVAGALADATTVNARFERSRQDLENIDEFMELLHRDAEQLVERIDAIERRVSVRALAPVRLTAFAPVEAMVPHVFASATTMRSTEMNTNFASLASTVEANELNALGIAAHHAPLTERVAALEEDVVFSDRCEDVRPDRRVRVSDVELEPPAPVTLPFDQHVTVTFDFVAEYMSLGYDGIRMWAIPRRDGEPALGTGHSPSPIVYLESGTVERTFSGTFLESGTSVQVNEVVVSIVGVQLDGEGSQLNAVSLLRCIVPTDVTFERP